MDPAERAAGAGDEPVGRVTEPALDPAALPEAGAATWTDTRGACPGPTEVETRAEPAGVPAETETLADGVPEPEERTVADAPTEPVFGVETDAEA